MAPIHSEHPIRSTFLDPRPGGYHFGVDIAVDDLHPEPGAPPGRSHRVYALDSGAASVRHAPRTPRPLSCTNRRVGVGHFAYWHVDPTVRDGEYVRAGQVIGWTCKGRWHLHLSEWASVGGTRVWVNPLHAGGKLVPYRNTTAPSIRSLRFFTPETKRWTWLGRMDFGTPLARDALHGPVELRVHVEDLESYTGWLARYGADATPANPPYKLAVRITDEVGRVVLSRVAFQSDRIATEPATVRFAPRTTLDQPLYRLLVSETQGSGDLWYRPFSERRLAYWDTSEVADGVYSVAVSAWDVSGNLASSVVPVVVAN